MQNKYVSDTLFGQCLFNPTKLDKVFDLISGELLEDNSEYEYCITARQFEYLCGVSGKNYILKDTKNKVPPETDSNNLTQHNSSNEVNLVSPICEGLADTPL